MTCCLSCANMARFADISLHKYIQQVHDFIHSIDSGIKTGAHLKKRAKLSNEEKAQEQLRAFMSDLKIRVTEFKTTYESPYFKKVQLYYPEIAKAFLQHKRNLCSKVSVLESV